MDWQQDRLRAIYFTTFRILRIVILCYYIYRLVWFWGNTPGQCFRPIDYNGFLAAFAACYILMDIYIGLGRLAYHSYQAKQRDRIDAMGQDIKAQNARDKAKRIQDVSIFVGTAIEGILLLSNSFLGISIVFANQMQIVGDENSFSFGQVRYRLGDTCCFVL